MHFAVAVIIPQRVVDVVDYIATQMQAFDENLDGEMTNPAGKWDWYVIGGRFDGWFGGKRTAAHQIEDHIAINRPPLWDDRTPAAILTPEGGWYARCQIPLGPIAESDGWHAEARKILARYPNHRVVILDAHR